MSEDRDYGFGVCAAEGCADPAIVKLNDAALCERHMALALTRIRANIDRIIDELRSGIQRRPT